MTLETMLGNLAAVDRDLDTLLAGNTLTEGQAARYESLMAERAQHVDAISRERATEDRRVAAAPGSHRITDRGSSRPQRSEPTPASTPTVPATARETQRNAGFRTPREFLSSVYQAGTGGRVDPRLLGLDVQASSGSDEARGNSDPYGGYLIPEAFSPDFLQIRPERDPMGSLTQKVPMPRPIVRIPARTDKNHTTSVAGGLTVTRRPETVAGTSSQMQMEQVVLEAHSLFGLSYATEEMLMDSAEVFIAMLETGFRDQFVYKLIDERINGTGVGEFEGVMKSDALVSVAREPGQGKTILMENILNMRSRCWGYEDAVWLANHDTLPQFGLMAQQVGTAGTGMIWLPSMREGLPDTLLGRPLMFTEYTQTLGTQGDLLLTNWSQFLEGTYQPIQGVSSIHVRFVQHERAFKFWTRNAGRCWWRSALTPKNSAKTLSPIVVLDTR